MLGYPRRQKARRRYSLAGGEPISWPASAGRAPTFGGRAALCLALAALACAHALPAGAPPPVPRGGAASADAWRALIALEGRELVLADAPPPAAAEWCEPIADTPHYRCQLDLAPLLLWRARVVQYAGEIDCLRGDREACNRAMERGQ